MKVYLLRHGETDSNIRHEFAGITDSKLSDLGKKQAVDAHLRFEHLEFDTVLSSPLSRALDTARVFTDSKVVVHEGLKEMNFGMFEGLTYEEIKEKYPEQIEIWHKDTKNYVFPEGQSLRMFYDHVVETYQEILDTYKVENLLIVAHSGVIRCILAHEIAENFEHYWRYSVDNCKLAVIEYTEDYHYLTGLNL
ncbi:histidine phosphatase family protein [Acidaminobacter sp. JC074]|uniref:histidine phosphatase family protein n=1 Tax=Acidaminobacter sp. JC074 TaxID=2530199 RepID=UPI001F0E67F3|nr:histidine phosphatase family protein [Acidaminobacter sp. JC074]MCH4889163.1 histidine phosphatase family protein [Acidaminobacter sp. JC074]